MQFEKARKWVVEMNQQDLWYLALDGVTEELPLSLELIKSKINSTDHKKAQFLHVSLVDLPKPPWIDIDARTKEITDAVSIPEVKLQDSETGGLKESNPQKTPISFESPAESLSKIPGQQNNWSKQIKSVRGRLAGALVIIWLVAKFGYGHYAEINSPEYQFNQGVECGENRKYTEAFQWYTKAANQGYSIAQYNLGVCYYNGQGVEQNYQKAFQWYTKAANQGNALAEYNLGVCYNNGQGVEQDYQKAFQWYTKAANQGDLNAQYNLGVRYQNGQGVKQDLKKAIEWYGKAAQQKSPEAIQALEQISKDIQDIKSLRKNL